MVQLAALLLAIPGLMTLLFALTLGGFGLLLTGMALLTGDPIDAIAVAAVYVGPAVASGLPATVQLVAGWHVWQGRGWTLGVAAASLTVLTGLTCCNVMGLGCGIGALVLLMQDEVRMELRGRELEGYED